MKNNKLSFKNFNIIFTVFAAIYIVISIINMVITAKINRLFESFLSEGSSLLRGFSLKGTSVKDLIKSSLQLTGGSNVDPSLRPSGIYSFILFVLLISFIVLVGLYLIKIFETNKNHKILNDLNIVLLLVSLFLTVLYTYKVDYINNTNTFFVGILLILVNIALILSCVYANKLNRNVLAKDIKNLINNNKNVAGHKDKKERSYQEQTNNIDNFQNMNMHQPSGNDNINLNNRENLYSNQVENEYRNNNGQN